MKLEKGKLIKKPSYFWGCENWTPQYMEQPIVGGLIDRLALRKKVNTLFNGATREQQMILLQD